MGRSGVGVEHEIEESVRRILGALDRLPAARIEAVGVQVSRAAETAAAAIQRSVGREATRAERRLEKCPFAEEKPTCVKCPVHCYEAVMRERVRQVMRYAGPRMLLRHPVLALLHLRDERRPLSEKAQRVAERLRRPD